MNEASKQKKTGVLAIIFILAIAIAVPQNATHLSAEDRTPPPQSEIYNSIAVEQAYKRCIEGMSRHSSNKEVIEKGCSHIRSACADDYNGFQCQNYLRTTADGFMEG